MIRSLVDFDLNDAEVVDDLRLGHVGRSDSLSEHLCWVWVDTFIYIYLLVYIDVCMYMMYEGSEIRTGPNLINDKRAT